MLVKKPVLACHLSCITRDETWWCSSLSLSFFLFSFFKGNLSLDATIGTYTDKFQIFHLQLSFVKSESSTIIRDLKFRVLSNSISKKCSVHTRIHQIVWKRKTRIMYKKTCTRALGTRIFNSSIHVSRLVRTTFNRDLYPSSHHD